MRNICLLSDEENKIIKNYAVIDSLSSNLSFDIFLEKFDNDKSEFASKFLIIIYSEKALLTLSSIFIIKLNLISFDLFLI